MYIYVYLAVILQQPQHLTAALLFCLLLNSNGGTIVTRKKRGNHLVLGVLDVQTLIIKLTLIHRYYISITKHHCLCSITSFDQ